jgi:hypothetical protein
VAFDSPGESLPLGGKSGVGHRPLADDVADVRRRLNDSPLDFEGGLLFAPVLELCAGCELRNEVGAMALEPLVWVMSGRAQAVQFQLDPLDV